MEIQQEQERQLEQERTEQQQLEHANKVCLSSAHVHMTLSNHK